MNVHQIRKIVVNRNKNIDEHVRMELVPGPAYISIEDAWTRIGELIERDMKQYISALQWASFANRQNLDWIKIVQESISIEIVGLGATIKTNDGLMEVTYGITGLEVI